MKNRINYISILQLIVLLICISVFNGCSQDNLSTPLAQKGTLDLTQWDFQKNDRIALDGEWKFFWHQLLTPNQIDAHVDNNIDEFYIIPNIWNNYTSDKKKSQGGHGYGTFVLEIIAPNHNIPLSLDITEILTSYSLWVNKQNVSRRGIVGRDAAEGIPESQPASIPLSPSLTGNKITLVLQVSNYHHRKGGPWTSIHLVRTDALSADVSMRLFINIFLVGSIFMIGLYHLSMFFLRKEFASFLYFGIFCLIISIRSLVTNERYLHILFPDFSWELLSRIEYLSFYLAIPTFAMFARSIFPEEFAKKVLRYIQIISLIFAAIVCLTPVWIFSHTVLAFQFVSCIFAVYLFYVFIKAHQNKRPGIYVNLMGYVILFITALNDILYVNGMIITKPLVHVGMFFFIFSQAFLLSIRYSRAFKKIRTQKQELGTTNQALKTEIQLTKTLQANLVQSHEKFQKSRVALILGLAKLAEYRDEDTGAHLKRIREFSILLAIGLSKIEKYKEYISEEYINDIYQSSILHDIGKVAIKDAILLKPGKLTSEEFDEIKRHSAIGGDALTEIEAEFKTKSFLSLGKHIAYAHHEKWDGTGYPDQLKEEDIPLSARIVAVADVYDALTSERPYKKAFSHEKACDIIIEGRAKHFDPAIVDLFQSLSKQFASTRKKFPD